MEFWRWRNPMNGEEHPSGMASAMDGTIIASIAYGRLLRLIQAGEVRGQRAGRKWFVDLEDLARWKREQREPVPAA
jgi:hypothetical protein